MDIIETKNINDYKEVFNKILNANSSVFLLIDNYDDLESIVKELENNISTFIKRNKIIFFIKHNKGFSNIKYINILKNPNIIVRKLKKYSVAINALFNFIVSDNHIWIENIDNKWNGLYVENLIDNFNTIDKCKYSANRLIKCSKLIKI